MPVSKLEVSCLFEYYKRILTHKPIVIGQYCYYLTNDWKLKFIKSKKVAGLCSIFPEKEIRISTQYMKASNVDISDVSDTLLHEFAHAIAGVQNAHNEIWRCIALVVGSSANVYSKCFAPYKYKIICPAGCQHFRHQLVRKTYTERTEGMATCRNHRDLPVLVIKMDDNSIVRSYAGNEDLNLVCQHFKLLSTG